MLGCVRWTARLLAWTSPPPVSVKFVWDGFYGPVKFVRDGLYGSVKFVWDGLYGMLRDARYLQYLVST